MKSLSGTQVSPLVGAFSFFSHNKSPEHIVTFLLMFKNSMEIQCIEEIIYFGIWSQIHKRISWHGSLAVSSRHGIGHRKLIASTFRCKNEAEIEKWKYPRLQSPPSECRLQQGSSVPFSQATAFSRNEVCKCLKLGDNSDSNHETWEIPIPSRFLFINSLLITLRNTSVS